MPKDVPPVDGAYDTGGLDPLLFMSLGVLGTFFLIVVGFAIKVLRDQQAAPDRADIAREFLADLQGEAQPRRRRQNVVAGRRRPQNARRRVGEDDDDVENEDVGGAFAAPPSGSEDDDFDVGDVPQVDADGKRIGKKKLAKLEAKAEKRAQREYELAEREDRKKRQAEQEEKERKEREKEEFSEKERLDAEKKARELKEQQEYEEYLKMKESFAVDTSGYEENTEEDAANMRARFVEHIVRAKVVNMDELGSAFGLKSSAVIERVRALLADGAIQGVIDDRGKFIYITDDELQAVAKFINQRGRVTMAELASQSNKLISLQGAATGATAQ